MDQSLRFPGITPRTTLTFLSGRCAETPCGGLPPILWDSAGGGPARRLMQLPMGMFMGLAVTPDERELCTTVWKPGGNDIMMFENFR